MAGRSESCQCPASLLLPGSGSPPCKVRRRKCNSMHWGVAGGVTMKRGKGCVKGQSTCVERRAHITLTLYYHCSARLGGRKHYKPWLCVQWRVLHGVA